MQRWSWIGIGAAVLIAVGGWLLVAHEGVGRGDVATSTSASDQPAFQIPMASSSVSSSATAPAASAAAANRTPPAGQKEYSSALYKFSLFYPSALSVQSHNEGAGAITITFQNVKEEKGFQIFIVPYDRSQVTEARFKEDEPSGVREGAKNVTIDGVLGTSFYSTNLALGPTAEIWFIRGGYLYEVTTLKPLAGWLAQIMGSWEFL